MHRMLRGRSFCVRAALAVAVCRVWRLRPSGRALGKHCAHVPGRLLSRRLNALAAAKEQRAIVFHTVRYRYRRTSRG